jgi:hypothetical protein
MFCFSVQFDLLTITFLPIHNKQTKQIDLNDGRHANIWDVRSSATYVQISIAVELLIFSCRTTGWFFMDMPSVGLISGVMIANVIVSLCAVYGVIVTPRLDWNWVGNIWVYNIFCLVIIDTVKIIVNKIIGNSHDDILGYADMPTIDSVRPSAMGGSRSIDSDSGRGSTRRSSVLFRPSRQLHNRVSHGGNIDYGGAARASFAPRSSSLMPNTPGNVAKDYEQNVRASVSGGNNGFWQGW